jgi:NCAIR mutase (PurE)-related protein
MSTRKKLLFKINNEVVVEETQELTLDQIEALKWVIAGECECQVDEIEVVSLELGQDLSDDIDVGVDGMHFWKSLFMKPVLGVRCDLKIGSDEYFDAINKGTLENHIHFFI